MTIFSFFRCKETVKRQSQDGNSALCPIIWITLSADMTWSALPSKPLNLNITGLFLGETPLFLNVLLESLGSSMKMSVSLHHISRVSYYNSAVNIVMAVAQAGRPVDFLSPWKFCTSVAASFRGCFFPSSLTFSYLSFF